MNHKEFRAARATLKLTAKEMAAALSEPPAKPTSISTIFAWESGRYPISGPVAVAVRLMVRLRELGAKSQDAGM